MEELKRQYLVAIHHPDDFDPSTQRAKSVVPSFPTEGKLGSLFHS
jgi:hypothetical protein